MQSDKRMARVLRRTFAALLLIAISACATAPTSLSNIASNDELRASVDANSAILVVAVAAPIGIGGRLDIRRVDIDARTFYERTGVSFNPWGIGDAMRAPSVEQESQSPAATGSRPDIALLVKQVPSGDYAITAYSSGPLFGCFKDSAVVVRLPPGTITIVNSGDILPPGAIGRLPANTDFARIRDAFQNARVNYPSLIGDPAQAEVVTRISWTTSGNWLDDTCYGGADTFTALQTEDVAAARAAALEAAQQNLQQATPEAEAKQ